MFHQPPLEPVGDYVIDREQHVAYLTDRGMRLCEHMLADPRLLEAGARFDATLLNPVENKSNYTTSKSMALNLGIFVCDLSFASMYEIVLDSFISSSAILLLKYPISEPIIIS